MDFKILTELGKNIPKSLTQNDAEITVTGRVLDHGKRRGYCFLMSLLYGLEEIGGNNLDEMVKVIKETTLSLDYFNKLDGSVGDANGLAEIITRKRNGLKRLIITDNLDVVRNIAYNARPLDRLFLLCHLPGHYIYVRLDGEYSNPLGEKDVDPSRIIGWELWKVI